MLCTDLPWQGINEDQNLGIAITRRALEAPLRAIVANAGEEPSVIVANVKAGEGSYGYNAGTVAKLAMRQPFVLFKGLTFQKLCLPGAFRPGDHHNKMLRPG
ncbi:hypothetical protein J4V47_25485, partial [Escherichia coli]